jgi:hypothetical protein
MNFITKFWQNIQTSNDQQYIDQITKLIAENSQLTINNVEFETDNLKLNENIVKKDQEIIEKTNIISNLQTQLQLKSDNVSEDDKKLETYWNTKYPIVSIYYNGRSYPFSMEEIWSPVNTLITPNDPQIISDLKSWELYRTGEDPETLAPKIHKKVWYKYYMYAFDKQVWNIEEVWETPNEMFQKIKKRLSETGDKQGFDCDSWGCMLASYYISAGIPRWRIRCVKGDTWVGCHYTNYLYSKLDSNWHHLNSTYGEIHNNISEYPTHEDARSSINPTGKDVIGVYKVDFSFNDLYCWNLFLTDIPKDMQVIK